MEVPNSALQRHRAPSDVNKSHVSTKEGKTMPWALKFSNPLGAVRKKKISSNTISSAFKSADAKCCWRPVEIYKAYRCRRNTRAEQSLFIRLTDFLICHLTYIAFETIFYHLKVAGVWFPEIKCGTCSCINKEKLFLKWRERGFIHELMTVFDVCLYSHE